MFTIVGLGFEGQGPKTWGLATMLVKVVRGRAGV